MNQLKYLLSAFVIFPFLPLMYWQGKSIRKKVPKLPEAAGPKGEVDIGKDKTLRLLTIGESTIAGVGAPNHNVGFTGTLAKVLSEQLKVNVDWQVIAKSGYTAINIKEKLLPSIVAQKADLIVIGLGGNDAFGLNSPVRWRKDVSGLITSLKENFENTPIVFTNMPPIKYFPAFTPLIKFTIGNLVELLGNELDKLTLDQTDTYYFAQKITFEDWSKRHGVENEPDKYFSDGVHPSLLTYQIWAKDMAHFICRNDNLKQVFR